MLVASLWSTREHCGEQSMVVGSTIMSLSRFWLAVGAKGSKITKEQTAKYQQEFGISKEEIKKL